MKTIETLKKERTLARRKYTIALKKAEADAIAAALKAKEEAEAAYNAAAEVETNAAEEEEKTEKSKAVSLFESEADVDAINAAKVAVLNELYSEDREAIAKAKEAARNAREEAEAERKNAREAEDRAREAREAFDESENKKAEDRARARSLTDAAREAQAAYNAADAIATKAEEAADAMQAREALTASGEDLYILFRKKTEADRAAERIADAIEERKRANIAPLRAAKEAAADMVREAKKPREEAAAAFIDAKYKYKKALKKKAAAKAEEAEEAKREAENAKTAAEEAEAAYNAALRNVYIEKRIEEAETAYNAAAAAFVSACDAKASEEDRAALRDAKKAAKEAEADAPRFALSFGVSECEVLRRRPSLILQAAHNAAAAMLKHLNIDAESVAQTAAYFSADNVEAAARSIAKKTAQHAAEKQGTPTQVEIDNAARAARWEHFHLCDMVEEAAAAYSFLKADADTIEATKKEAAAMKAAAKKQAALYYADRRARYEVIKEYTDADAMKAEAVRKAREEVKAAAVEYENRIKDAKTAHDSAERVAASFVVMDKTKADAIAAALKAEADAANALHAVRRESFEQYIESRDAVKIAKAEAEEAAAAYDSAKKKAEKVAYASAFSAAMKFSIEADADAAAYELDAAKAEAKAKEADRAAFKLLNFRSVSNVTKRQFIDAARNAAIVAKKAEEANAKAKEKAAYAKASIQKAKGSAAEVRAHCFKYEYNAKKAAQRLEAAKKKAFSDFMKQYIESGEEDRAAKVSKDFLKAIDAMDADAVKAAAAKIAKAKKERALLERAAHVEKLKLIEEAKEREEVKAAEADAKAADAKAADAKAALIEARAVYNAAKTEADESRRAAFIVDMATRTESRAEVLELEAEAAAIMMYASDVTTKAKAAEKATRAAYRAVNLYLSDSRAIRSEASAPHLTLEEADADARAVVGLCDVASEYEVKRRNIIRKTAAEVMEALTPTQKKTLKALYRTCGAIRPAARILKRNEKTVFANLKLIAADFASVMNNSFADTIEAKEVNLYYIAIQARAARSEADRAAEKARLEAKKERATKAKEHAAAVAILNAESKKVEAAISEKIADAIAAAVNELPPIMKDTLRFFIDNADVGLREAARIMKKDKKTISASKKRAAERIADAIAAAVEIDAPHIAKAAKEAAAAADIKTLLSIA